MMRFVGPPSAILLQPDDLFLPPAGYQDLDMMGGVLKVLLRY
jgi:hypothetical protein